MKKVLTALLACLLAVGLCACNNDEPTTPETTAATQSGEENNILPIKPPAKVEETVKLKNGAENVRVFGVREELSDTVLNCNYPGSGFEVKLNCEGSVINVRTSTSDACDFRVWVDGEAWKNADGGDYFTVNGVKNIEIPNVSKGEHTVRVIRASEKGVTAMFYNVTFEGEQSELSATEAMTVEFVGDGITAGAKLNGENCDATLGYAYKTAAALGVNYGITASVGQGVLTGTSPIGTSYAKEGNYANKADIIVVNVGAEDFAVTGDGAITAEAFAEAYTALLKNIRTKNGSACKIVCVTTASSEALRTAVANVCQQLGGESAGYFVKALTVSAATLPTEAEHTAYATELSAYLNSIKDITIEVNSLKDAESGAGEKVDYGTANW